MAPSRGPSRRAEPRREGCRRRAGCGRTGTAGAGLWRPAEPPPPSRPARAGAASMAAGLRIPQHGGALERVTLLCSPAGRRPHGVRCRSQAAAERCVGLLCEKLPRCNPGGSVPVPWLYLSSSRKHGTPLAGLAYGTWTYIRFLPD